MAGRAPPAALADPLAVADWIEAAAQALAASGWFRAVGAIPAATVGALAGDLGELVDADRLHRAGIGRDRDFQVDRDVRRDWIFWMSRRRPAQAAFLAGCERLRAELNRRLFLGLFEFEAHLALYPEGAFYKRHFDSFRGAANRMVSLVVYLNDEWQPGDGGELVLYAPDSAAEIARIEPRAGTLVLFLSEEMEHEVSLTTAPRASIAGWFRLNNTSAEVVDPPR